MTLKRLQSKHFWLTVHGKHIAGLSPMARRLSLPTLDEGRQTGSPLVPYKLPWLLPHKGRVPGRSRDSPSWTGLLTVQEWATQQWEEEEKTETPFPGSACPVLESQGFRGSPAPTCDTPVTLCLFGIQLAPAGAFQCDLVGKNMNRSVTATLTVM